MSKESFSDLVLLLLLLACCSYAYAAPDFPTLTDRVVDQANILSINTESELKRLLAEHENQTTNQVVVVTLMSLQGYEIADYGYQLGRHWGIGQKDKDNGALLIIAPNERKIRIEVGYGLEGTLTDALSSYIITHEITPYFKNSDYDSGVSSGIKAMIKTLNNDVSEYNTHKKESNDGEDIAISFFSLFPILILVIFLGDFFHALGRRSFFRSISTTGIFGLLTWALTTSLIVTGFASLLIFLFAMFGSSNNSKNRRNNSYDDFGGGFGGGTFGGGGFGGGGGGFGGGGASGSW